MYQCKKAPLSGPQNKDFSYTVRSVTLHKTSCIDTHIFEHLFVPNRSGTTEATRGCGRVWHVLSRPISMFVFDTVHIPCGYIISL
jgi:hypothetical protein